MNVRGLKMMSTVALVRAIRRAGLRRLTSCGTGTVVVGLRSPPAW